MKTLWRDADRAALGRRLDAVAPTDLPRWGRMNAPRMLRHVSAQMRMALGDLPVRLRKTPLARTPIKQFVVFWMPWPKGLPTAPELLPAPDGDWQEDRAAVRELLDRCAGRGPAGPWAPHPAFGRLSGRAWGVLLYRHTDHHLRQFGR